MVAVGMQGEFGGDSGWGLGAFGRRAGLIIDDVSDSLDSGLENLGAAGGSAQDEGTLERGHHEVG
jgi:hypothetical protein